MVGAAPEHQAGPRLDVRDPEHSPIAIDTIRALFTYTIALVVVVGGGAMLFLTRAEPNSGLAVQVGVMIGSALTFVFGQEIQTRTARQAAASTAASTAATTATLAAANSGVGVQANGGPAADAVTENTAAIAKNTETIAENTAPDSPA